MSMGKLRFLVESLQFMADGKAELEGDALQGLYELLEDSVLQVGLERHQLRRRLDEMELINRGLVEMKCQQVVDEFKASLRV